MVAVFERELEQCSLMFVRYRQLSQMLQARLKEVQAAKRFEERMYQDRWQTFLSRSVTEEHVALLSRHSSDPLPTPVQRDLNIAKAQACQEEQHQCSLTIPAVLGRETRA